MTQILRKRINTFIFFVCFSSLFSCCNKKENKPNIIFILVDDLGWTDTSSYGSKFYQTPNIDYLASNGVKFTNAYAASNVCSPTRASILTGKYPARLHLTDFIPGKISPNTKLLPPKWNKFLDTSEITIAKAFKNYGYTTAHIGKWHLGKDKKYWPENHGFDINIGGWSSGQPIINKRKNSNGYFSPYGNPKLEDGKQGEYLTKRLTEEAKQFIKNNQSKPFFLNLWFYSVHTPLQAEKEKIEKYQRKKNKSIHHKNPTYAAMVEHVDDAVGEIIKTLQDLHLDKETIIVFTSDNGGLIGNHARFKEKVTSNYPLRSGKGDVYEGGVRVPTIFYYPSKIKPRAEKTPIISVDFFPTLLQLSEIKNKDDYNFDGVSLADILIKNENLEVRPLFWHYPHYHTEGAKPHSAIRFKNYKLIHHLETDSLQLFNLEKDIGEKINIANIKPKTTVKLFSMLQEFKQKVKAQEPIINLKYIKYEQE